MKIDKSKFKKIVMCAITALGTVFVGLTLFAKAKRKTSVYENEKQEKNPMEGKRVVFVRNDDDNENADGVRGHVKEFKNNSIPMHVMDGTKHLSKIEAEEKIYRRLFGLSDNELSHPERIFKE